MHFYILSSFTYKLKMFEFPRLVVRAKCLSDLTTYTLGPDSGKKPNHLYCNVVR